MLDVSAVMGIMECVLASYSLTVHQFTRSPINHYITMLLVQILAAVVFFGLIVLAILAFIEPGPLDRRSRDRRGQRPPLPGESSPKEDDQEAAQL